MAKKIIEQPKSDNIVFTAFQYTVAWVKANRGTAIAAAAIFVCIVLLGWAFAAYQANRAERAQYDLSQSIRSFQEYTATKNGEALNRAEAQFGKMAKHDSGAVRDVANLYLARIAVAKGNTAEATKLYGELSKKSSSDVVQKLAQNALQDLQKKQ